MQLQLMRKEVLLLTCATSKVLTDAQKVLQGCLDPPESKAVEQAAQYLLSERLVQRQTQPTLSKRSGKALALQPTLLGRLIDSMPLDIEASTLVMLGAFLGLLEEAVLLAVLRCQQPMVIKREPNKRLEYEGRLAIYGPRAQVKSRDEAFAEDELLANLAAVTSFQAWQADPRRLRRARKGAVASGPEGDRVRLVGLKARHELNGLMIEVGAFNELKSRYAVRLDSGESILVRRINLAEPEAEWCRARGLSHTALLAVLRTVEHVLQSLFRWHPPLLQRHHARQLTLVRNASSARARPNVRQASSSGSSSASATSGCCASCCRRCAPPRAATGSQSTPMRSAASSSSAVAAPCVAARSTTAPPGTPRPSTRGRCASSRWWASAGLTARAAGSPPSGPRAGEDRR